ncbi:MAG: DUF3173 family protein [Lactobacillales bacterium]|nr:DUF3173 family protein [Lactobacillales bacterium]
MTKQDLMFHGYTEYEARAILKSVKCLLVQSGHTFATPTRKSPEC